MKFGLTALAGLAAIAMLLGASAPSETPMTTPIAQADDTVGIHAMEMAKIMKKCKLCHGKDLAGKQKKKKKTPAIAGLSKAKLLKSLTTDIAKPMKAIAKALTDEEKAKVSELISKMPKTAAP